jgi:hypothetical protein
MASPACKYQHAMRATMRLHGGDRIRVDGERGTVEVLERAAVAG